MSNNKFDGDLEKFIKKLINNKKAQEPKK